MEKFAFIFPGQGSQTVGMLSNLAIKYPVIKATFIEASNILGYDLWELTQKGPIEELNKTWKTQPALLTASVALWRIWKQKGGKPPSIMAGHSLGEYSALVLAKVISFKDAIRLVEIRGKLMQATIPEDVGAMSAIIGLDDITVIEACKEAAKGQIVTPANYNSPNQIIIAGHKEAVVRANIICKSMGAKCILPLPVSVPSHCVLMKLTAGKLATQLSKIKFNTPIIPVINNVDVRCETRSEMIRDALIRQLYNPVQWHKTIKFITSQGIYNFYEVGPGRVLTNLTKRIVNTATAIAIEKSDVLSTIFSR